MSELWHGCDVEARRQAGIRNMGRAQAKGGKARGWWEAVDQTGIHQTRPHTAPL
jgi:hypothetical protein